MKRWLFLALPAVILVSVFGTLRFVIQPGVEIWALSQVQSLVSGHTPFEMAADSLDIGWIPLKVSIENPRVRTKITGERGADGDMGPLGFEKARAQRLTARVDFMQLLSGRMGVSVALVEGLDLTLDLDPLMKSKGPSQEIPWKKVFEIARLVPVRSVALLNNHVRLVSKKLNLDLDINELSARLGNQRDELSLEVQTGRSSGRFQELVSEWVLGGEASLTPQAIEIQKLLLTTPKQSLQISGLLTDLPQLLKQPRGRLQVLAKANLIEVQSLLPGKQKLPLMSGEVDIESSIELQGRQLPTGRFRVDARDLHIGQVEAGHITTTGHFDGHKLKLPLVNVKHSAGEAQLKDVELEIENPDTPLGGLLLKSKISTRDLDLHQLLKGIGVGDLPLGVALSGDLDCGGPIVPRPNLVCVGTATGRELFVNIKDDKTGKLESLAKLKAFEVEGVVQISGEAVTYQAKAKIESDTGTSSGSISYEKGFHIQFDTDSVQLSHISEIAGLKIEGVAAIKGSTSGDSDMAIFEMNIRGKDLYFEDFGLGEAEGNLSYKAGHLYFQKLVGKFRSSPYRADLDVNLPKSRLKVTANSPNLLWEDLFELLNRKFEPPVPITGATSMQVELEGPFSLGQLSYLLQVKSPYFLVGGETFRDGVFEIRAINGEVKSEKATARKGSQNIQIKGAGHPNGNIEIDLVGNQLLLEESELVNRLGSNISGFIDIGVQIRGFILDPDIAIQTQLGQMVIEDQEFPPSAAAMTWNRRQLEGSVRLFAGRLFGDFIFPFVKEGPFRLKMQASDWNFATLATLIGGGNLLSEYESSITGDLSLNSDKGGFWAASGRGTVQSLLLKRGSQSLKNTQPMKLSMNQGSVTIENFRLDGGADSIELSAQQFSREALRMKIDGQVSLRIFQIFVPFLEEVGGKGRIGAVISGSLNKPEILGSAQLRDGFARIRGFPHPLERLSASVQFSASRVSISDINGSLAGGSVTGEGSVLLMGPKNIPVSIRAQAQGVTLNVPDKIQTSGDLDLTFSGNWFPYTLAGTYRVTGGLFTKELQGDGISTNVQQSTYLPKVILQSGFQPVLLDLQVDLVRPLQLKNSMIEGLATGQLLVKGPPATPSILGQVSVPSGTKITFRDKIFDVDSATLKFQDPKELNPELFVSARSRINEYDISLLVQGTAKDPLIRMSSTPPLSESDIITLLALGITSQKLEKQVQSREQESSTGYEILSPLIQELPITKALSKNLGVNLQISSGYDDTKNIAVQKITLSRQLSERVNAAVSQSRGEQNSTEARVQYFFNPNMSAIGSWEGRERTEGTSVTTQENSSESIFGIDLEFKQEFK